MKEDVGVSSADYAKTCDSNTAACPVLVQTNPDPASVVPIDPRLARILDAWPTLPEPIRRAMLALIEQP
jgi:hypothetical protein